MAKSLPSLEWLKANFHYDPETGAMTRLKRSGGYVPGDRVGYKQPNGYIYCSTPYGAFSVHRIAYYIMTGTEPVHDIDHINGIRDDNRFANLRHCTRSQNLANSGVKRSNKIGVKGVAAHGKRFVAHIRLNGRKKHLGVFSTKEEAHAVYMQAAVERFGEFAHGGAR